MKKYFKIRNKGITLITLVVAVSIMIIISSLLIYNARTGIKVRNYKMMQNDIELLDDKVSAYYMKYGALPVEIKYNITPLPFESVKNPNDNENYYVLDLKVFEGLTLNYGSDYDKVTESNVADFTDLYIINEQSHQIYYAKGIEMDGVMYYTNDISEEVSTIEQKWKKVLEGETTFMLGIDNMGNLYGLDESYNGTIKNNTNYTNSELLFPELIDADNINIVKASASISFSFILALDDQGKIYSWGNNKYGQLGNGSYNENNTIPRAINDITGNILNGKKIISISAGSKSSAAVDNEGKVYTWGNNEYGQLGNGTTEDTNIPICISDISSNILNGKNVKYISIGGGLWKSHVIAIDNEGKVYAWGSNEYGQLGNGTDIEYSTSPICISDISGNILNGKKIVGISAGASNTIALDEEGKVYTWGYNSNGQLGNGATNNSNSPICISDISGNILNGKNIVSISGRAYHTVAIDNEGKVYTWGGNRYGELGNGKDGYSIKSTSPICISDISGNILKGKKILKISAGEYITSAVDNNGKVYTWGYNALGQLGNETYTNSNIPICISDIAENILKGKNIVEISTGGRNIIAIDSQGKVYTWGYNEYGQLGNGTKMSSNTPIQIFKEMINIIKDKYIVEISSNYQYAALDNKGKVYTWGEDNRKGQLGNGTYEASIVPICISDISENTLNGRKIVAISTGYNNTIALDEEGKVYTWGDNAYGQLGNGTGENSNVPICISEIEGNILNGKNIVAISIGSDYIVAIDNEGKVYTWGDNRDGQLGNGTEESSNIPICISDIEGNILNKKKIVKISTISDHTIALDEEGKVYTWGDNSCGQLGNGESGEGMYSNLPICISDKSENILNGKKIVEIAAGAWHTGAVDSEGKVYTWGTNYIGQLGHMTEFVSAVPICISDIEGNILNGKNIVSISVGGFHTVVIDDLGEVYIFGKYTSMG